MREYTAEQRQTLIQKFEDHRAMSSRYPKEKYLERRGIKVSIVEENQPRMTQFLTRNVDGTQTQAILAPLPAADTQTREYESISSTDPSLLNPVVVDDDDGGISEEDDDIVFVNK